MAQKRVVLHSGPRHCICGRYCCRHSAAAAQRSASVARIHHLVHDHACHCHNRHATRLCVQYHHWQFCRALCTPQHLRCASENASPQSLESALCGEHHHH